MTTKVEILKEVIRKKSKNQTIMVLDSILEHLDDQLIREITNPEVITELHAMLIEFLGVNPQAMKLKKRVALRHRRAILFLRAMKAGVMKVKD